MHLYVTNRMILYMMITTCKQYNIAYLSPHVLTNFKTVSILTDHIERSTEMTFQVISRAGKRCCFPCVRTVDLHCVLLFQCQSSRPTCRVTPTRLTPSSWRGTHQRTQGRAYRVTSSTTTTHTSDRTCASPSLRQGTRTSWRTWHPTRCTTSVWRPSPWGERAPAPRPSRSARSSMVSTHTASPTTLCIVLATRSVATVTIGYP